MRVLAAPTGDYPRDDDGFNYCLPGELLTRSTVCDSGREGRCGCERSWSGIASGKAVTLAHVVDRDVQAEVYAATVADHLTEQGWPRQHAEEEAAFLAELAAEFNVGAYVTITLTEDQSGHEFAELDT